MAKLIISHTNEVKTVDSYLVHVTYANGQQRKISCGDAEMQKRWLKLKNPGAVVTKVEGPFQVPCVDL